VAFQHFSKQRREWRFGAFQNSVAESFQQPDGSGNLAALEMTEPD
jgi:hypothetical protein